MSPAAWKGFMFPRLNTAGPRWLTTGRAPFSPAIAASAAACAAASLAPKKSSSSQRYAPPVSPALLSSTQRPGTTWQLVQRLPAGSKIGRAVTICTGVVVPSTAPVCPSSATPEPSSALSVSAPPTKTGVPSGSPVAAAAAAVTRPTRAPVSRSVGRIVRGMSSAARISSDHARRATS